MTPTKLVRDLMTSQVITCRPDSPLSEVVRKMEEHRIHALVVVETDGALAGVISQADLMKTRIVQPYWKHWRGMNARHLMARQVITCQPDTNIEDAIRLITNHRIHRLVVVEEREGKQWPVGVLSMTDVVRDMARESEASDVMAFDA